MITMASVWGLFRDNWGSQWASPMGDEKGTQIRTWAKTLFKYHQSDILAGANSLVENWIDKYPPSLPQFKQYVLLAKQRREAEERRTGPKAIEHTKAAKEFSRRYIEICKRIAKSPTSREASPDDVESFDESYRNLGLDQRWPD